MQLVLIFIFSKFRNIDLFSRETKFSKNKVYTLVYIKPANTGECLNYNSLCPMQYKTGVINTLLHRAYTVCSNMDKFSQEINRLKQILVNNNFPRIILLIKLSEIS